MVMKLTKIGGKMEKEKKEWIEPKLVSVEESSSTAECASGNSDVLTCSTGNSALLQCLTGNSANF